MTSGISPAGGIDASGVHGRDVGPAASRAEHAAGAPPAAPVAGTALVPLDRPVARSAPMRADASFLTQLLAVRAGVPQARLRRRIEPDAGAAAYRSSLGLSDVAVPARPFSRKA